MRPRAPAGDLLRIPIVGMHAEDRRATCAQAAQGLTARQPDVLIHRVLGHFQRLFECLTLDATMARMNQVWPRSSALAVLVPPCVWRPVESLRCLQCVWRSERLLGSGNFPICVPGPSLASADHDAGVRHDAQLYKEVGEKRSFARNLAALLGLPDNATCAALMTGVRALLHRWSRCGGCAHVLIGPMQLRRQAAY